MWFNVDDRLRDLPEVRSIPKRYRASAVGVWTLCGTYVSGALTDGFVPDEVIKDCGGTPALRLWLTRSGLWDEAVGGVTYTPRGCRVPVAQDVAGKRAATAQRVRDCRARKQNGADLGDESVVTVLHDDGVTPGVTEVAGNGLGNGLGSVNHIPSSQAESLPKSGTELDASGIFLPGTGSPPLPPSAITEARELVRAAVENLSYVGRKERRSLESRVLELLGDGLPADAIAEGLRQWVQTEDVYPGHLGHMVTEIMKRRAGVLRPRNGQMTGTERTYANLAALDRKYAARQAASKRGEITT
jgi:hypothetical protein